MAAELDAGNRTSSSMRGRRKRATVQRACALLYRSTQHRSPGTDHRPPSASRRSPTPFNPAPPEAC